MRKNKSFLVISIVGILALVLMVTAGITLGRQKGTSFQADGYVMETSEQDDGTLQAVQDQFAAGSNYKANAMGTVNLKDLEGTSVQMEKESFVHYTDGSLSAFAEGTIVDMNQVDAGLMTSYNAPAQTVLSSSGANYVTDNNSYELSFTDFLWKLTDTKYMAVSSNIQIQLAGGDTATAEGFVEFTYLEAGIVQIVTKDQAWQVLAAGSKLDLANGTTIYLDTQEIMGSSGNARMTLAEINTDSAANIQIAASDEWVPPTFNITTIDGEDGEAGDEGEAGQQGEAGTAGSEGESGDSGKTGSAGESGKDGETGATGATGGSRNNGANGNTGGTAANMPNMNLLDLDVTAGSISFRVEVGEGGWELEDVDRPGEEAGTVQLINTESGAVVKTWNVNFNNGDTVFPSEEETFTFTDLSADTKYRIVVSSPYHYDITTENNTITRTGTKAFIDRTVYTDSTGVYLNSVTTTDTSISGTVEVKPYALTSGSATYLILDIVNAEGNCISNSADLPYIQKISEISTAGGSGWALENGSYVYHYTFNDTNSTVESDKTYTVKLYTTTSSIQPATPNDAGVTLKDSEEVRTLKPVPKVGNLVSETQTGYFNLYIDSILTAGVQDNSMVTQWTYYIKKNDQIVKTLTSKTADAVQLSVDGTVIQYGETYTATAEVTVYDNEKNVVLPAANTVSLTMHAAGDSYVYFTEGETADEDQDGTPEVPGITYDRIRGTVTVVPNDRTILVGDSYPVYYQVENTAGTYKGDKTKIDYRPGLNGTDVVITKNGSNTLSFPLDLKGLPQGSDYVISVYGTYYEQYKQGADGTEADPASRTEGLLGKYVVSTKESMPLTILLNPVTSGEETKINVNIQLPTQEDLKATTNWVDDATKNKVVWTGTAEEIREKELHYLYMLSRISGIQVTLYQGNSATDSLKVISKDITGNNLKNLYTSGGTISITEQVLGVASSSLNGTYYLKVTSIYDDAGNQISGLMPVEENNRHSLAEEIGIAVTAESALPSLPDAKTGVTATPIYNGPGTDGSKMYAPSYGIKSDPKLAADTIVGYRLQAKFDSTCERVKSVTYYALLSSDVETYYEHQSEWNTTGGDPITYYTAIGRTDKILYKFTIPVGENGNWTMPAMILYFGTSSTPTEEGHFDAIDFKSTATSDTGAMASVINAYGKAINDTYGMLDIDNDYSGIEKDGQNPKFYHLPDKTTTTVVARTDALSRGHHYTFAYTANTNMDGSDYTYPNSMPAYQPGIPKSFLSTDTISVWKQPVTADTYLYQSGLSGSYNSTSVTVEEDNSAEVTEKKYAGVLGIDPNITTDIPLDDFFIWKYWLKDPDHAQPSDDAFQVPNGYSNLIGYTKSQTNDDGTLEDYGMLFFQSSTTPSLTSTCAITVQQKLFDTVTDGSFPSSWTEKWNCGDDKNSYTIAFNQAGSIEAVEKVNLIGGGEAQTHVSKRIHPENLKWDVTIDNNVAKLSVNTKPGTGYTTDMLDDIMKRILFLDVEASYVDNSTRKTRRFSSYYGAYKLEKVENGYEIRWDVTLLDNITVGKDVTFKVNCYYDTGYGTMDAELLEAGMNRTTGGIHKVSSTTNETFNAAYALENLSEQNYIVPAAYNIASAKAWTQSTTTTPGQIAFYNLSMPDVTKDGAFDWSETTGEKGIQLWAKTYRYANSNNSDSGTSWASVDVADNDKNNIWMKFYRETGGMKQAKGGTLNYSFKKVGYYTYQEPVTAGVTSLLPSMTKTDSRVGLEYLDYYISSGSANLLTKSDATIYLKVYKIPDDFTQQAEDVTENVTVSVQTGSGSLKELNKTTVEGSKYFPWKLNADETSYRIRLSGLEKDTQYAIEAHAYPDVKSEEKVNKGSWTLVVDSNGKTETPNVTKDNTNFILRTRKSVTLSDISLKYVNKSYEQKGLEISFATNVYEGYKIWCQVYEYRPDGKYDASDAKVIYSYNALLGQYTEENNQKYTGDSNQKDYNYLKNATQFNGRNTFWIPFPPGATNKLVGGNKYTVILRAVAIDDVNTILNDPGEGKTDPDGFEFVAADGVSISKGAAYVIISRGRAQETSTGTASQHQITITLRASDPQYQIAGGTYSLYLKRTKDENGNEVTDGKTYLGMKDNQLCWLNTDDETRQGTPATEITVGDTNAVWKDKISVAGTETTKTITLTNVPSGTYEIYTRATIDLDAGGPGGSQILTAYRNTVTTLSDSKILEGTVYPSTKIVNGQYVLVLEFVGWDNLDLLDTVECAVVDSNSEYLKTFVDCAEQLKKDSKIELTLTGANAGNYSVGMNMTMKYGNTITPVDLKTSSWTFKISN